MKMPHRSAHIQWDCRIGTLPFGLSFGLASKNNRTANAASKTLLKSSLTEYRGGCHGSANVLIHRRTPLSFDHYPQ